MVDGVVEFVGVGIGFGDEGFAGGAEAEAPGGGDDFVGVDLFEGVGWLEAGEEGVAEGVPEWAVWGADEVAFGEEAGFQGIVGCGGFAG